MALTPKIFYEVAEDAGNILDDIQSHMTVIDSNVDVISGNWTDENGQKFVAEYESLKKEFPSLYAAIAEMIKNMKFAHKAYTEVYEANAKAVGMTRE